MPLHARSVDTGFTYHDGTGQQSDSVLDFLGFKTQQDDEQPDTDHLHERVRQAIRMMPPREAKVIYGRFFKDQTLEQIGDQMGVTRERIRQIEAKALITLREYLKDTAS
jgi:RNA polymerase primary sigma factor